jgi:hypothetical protein
VAEAELKYVDEEFLTPDSATGSEPLRIATNSASDNSTFVLSDPSWASSNGDASSVSTIWMRIDAPTKSSRTEETGQIPRWLHYIDKRLDKIARSTPQELDGYVPPTEKTIASARAFVYDNFRSGTPTPSVVPLVQGGIQFIWHKGDWFVEVSISEEGATVWARNPVNGELLKGPLGELSPDLRDLLANLSIFD